MPILAKTAAVVAVAACALSGCASGHAVTSRAMTSRAPEPLRINGNSPSVAMVENGDIVWPASRPQSALHDAARTLIGYASPLALTDRRMRTVLYNSWRPASGYVPAGQVWGVPDIHSLDVATGTDRVLADGAQSVAWRGAGPVAYFAAARQVFHADGSDIGQVLVRRTPAGAPVAWTKAAARYTVLAWAGSALLVNRTPASQEGYGDLLLLRGPGRAQMIGRNNSVLVGVSPDAHYAVVLTQTPPGFRPRPPSLHIVDVRTGRRTGVVDLGGRSSVPLFGINETGDWQGHRLVVSTGTALAVFDWRVAGGRPVLRWTSALSLAGTGADVVAQPRLAGADSLLAIGWRQPVSRSDQPHYVVERCAVSTGTCVGLPTDRATFGRDLAFLGNPSRPLR
jgi:hypothetical protein